MVLAGDSVPAGTTLVTPDLDDINATCAIYFFQPIFYLSKKLSWPLFLVSVASRPTIRPDAIRTATLGRPYLA